MNPHPDRRTIAIRQTLAAALALGAVVALVAHLTGCKEFLPAADDPEFAEINADLAKCRAEARAARDAGADPSSSYMKYEDCKRREHVEVSP